MKNHIRKLRQERGLTQGALGAACDMHPRYIQKLEYGEQDIGNVSLKNLLAMAEVLGVTICDLFDAEKSTK